MDTASNNIKVEIISDVLQAIRQHARSSLNAEVCGVLIGTSKNDLTNVEACISGEKAAQGGAHVTFTQETWEHIYKVKDKQFPNEAIVGWYHSHPGFGVFLSEYDLFIHRNFFSNPGQVAWVYDPKSDEEGCFIWSNDEIVRISGFSLIDHRGMGNITSNKKSKLEDQVVPQIVIPVTNWRPVARPLKKRLIRVKAVLFFLINNRKSKGIRFVFRLAFVIFLVLSGFIMGLWFAGYWTNKCFPGSIFRKNQTSTQKSSSTMTEEYTNARLGNQANQISLTNLATRTKTNISPNLLTNIPSNMLDHSNVRMIISSTHDNSVTNSINGVDLIPRNTNNLNESSTNERK
jgi:proteasome lid subunit RPN8/RPN11